MLAFFIADLLLVLHLAFIVFVATGALWSIKHPRLIIAHAPALLWGAALEINRWPCPLTRFEIGFRRSAKLAGYGDGLIERYLTPIVYPQSLTPEIQIWIGFSLIAINLPVYVYLTGEYLSHRRKR